MVTKRDRGVNSTDPLFKSQLAEFSPNPSAGPGPVLALWYQTNGLAMWHKELVGPEANPVIKHRSQSICTWTDIWEHIERRS